MATLALAPAPAPAPATSRDVAAIIAVHRTIRQQILSRSTPSPPPLISSTGTSTGATPINAQAHTHSQAQSLGFQPKDALARLQQIEHDFARYRKKSDAQLEAAHAENRRLRVQLKEAEAKFAHLAVTGSSSFTRAKSVPASGITAVGSGAGNGIGTKPHEKELSVSKLEASTAAAEEQKTAMTTTTPIPPRFAKRNQSARPAESRWRPFTVSRSRSATCVTRSALEDRDDSGAGAGANGKRGRASTGGLFKRSSLSFSRSNRSSRGSDKSRPGSGMWTNCF